MGNDELLTDDFVAGRLTQEANDCSLKYSALGMEGYTQTKKPANMLKPNTRFLRHIIKGTDSHNKALLAKEALESQARLKDLERSEEAKRLKTNPTSRDVRNRQMGDIHAILGGGKRQRANDANLPSKPDLISSFKSDEGTDSLSESKTRGRPTKRSEEGGRNGDLTKDRHHERVHLRRLSFSDDHPGRVEKPDREKRSTKDNRRKRSRSKSAGEGERRRRHRKRSGRSRSPEHRRRSRSPRRRKNRHRERSPMENRESKSKQDKEKRKGDDSDSSPDLFGPAPAPTYRGRGRFGGNSGIDRRFSETYDPKTDTRMDDADDAADEAAELFRDRQKLKHHQQQRMREAGFSEDQVKRTEAPEPNLEENVRWSKAGEKRAWDQGKTIDADGSVLIADVV